jgi:GTP cyclohydrolase I
MVSKKGIIDINEAIDKTIVINMLKAIGENPNREGLQDTPKRVVKMWREMFRGYDPKQRPTVTTFNNGKDGIVYDEMITDTGDFYSQCEHHMVPFFGSYYFAYIPHPQGKLLGLSKVARVVDYYSAKLQIQERLVHEIVEHIWNELCKGTEYKPLGIALILQAEHLCKSMRGVKKKGKMRTTKLKGVFFEQPAARAEFMGWANKNGQ